MLDYYVLSTNLHLFQAFHIASSYEGRKSIFFVEESISCDFIRLLPGKVRLFRREDGYLSVLKSVLSVRRRKGVGRRIFFGNQVHSIVSVLLNKYEFGEIYVLDDGLQYYGKGVEKKGAEWVFKNLIVRNGVNYLFSLFGKFCVSTRDYLSFPRLNVEPKLISFMSGFSGFCSLGNVEVVSFGEYFCISKHRDISREYFDLGDGFVFCSYSESHALALSGSDVEGLVLHPRFRKEKYPCPFEFAWDSNFSDLKQSTSLYYVVEFVRRYEN